MWFGVGTWLKGAGETSICESVYSLLSALAPHTPHTPYLFGLPASTLMLTCAEADTNRASPLRRRAYSTYCVLVLLAGLPCHPCLLLCCAARRWVWVWVHVHGMAWVEAGGRAAVADAVSSHLSFTPSRHPFPPCADHGYQSLPCCPTAPPLPLYIASSCSVAPPSSLRFI